MTFRLFVPQPFSESRNNGEIDDQTRFPNFFHLPQQISLWRIVVCYISIVGCGAERGAGGPIPVSQSWVDRSTTRIIAWIEDGTGIVLDKEAIKIDSLGARLQPGESGYVSDFKITVNYRNSEFSCTAKGVPCSEAGIPIDEGNQKIKDAVQEIKRNIKAFQG